MEQILIVILLAIFSIASVAASFAYRRPANSKTLPNGYTPQTLLPPPPR